jgi:peptidyl-tRNA hydrolase, PTH1 family
MQLFVGLGNPGAQYVRNRHNVGFMAVDALAARHGFGPWKRRFQAEVAEGIIGGARILLFKPLTFMNESGRAVGEAARFLKIPMSDILVFYDDLDLAPGKVKIKTGGGAAGHNGIRSLDAHLGQAYRRVRIGIGHPGTRDAVMPYVLGDFAKADAAAWLEPLLDAVALEAPWLAQHQDTRFLTALALHLKPSPIPEDTIKGTV